MKLEQLFFVEDFLSPTLPLSAHAPMDSLITTFLPVINRILGSVVECLERGDHDRKGRV